MSEYDKYVFRLYKGVNRIPSDGGTTEMSLAAPYMQGNVNGFDTELVHKPGDIIHEDKSVYRVRPNYTMFDWDAPARRVKHYSSNGITVVNAEDAAPHKGISVIGLADPQYSLYSPMIIKRRLLNRTDDGRYIYNTNFARALPDSAFEQYLDAILADESRYARGIGTSKLQSMINSATHRGRRDNTGNLILDPNDVMYGYTPEEREEYMRNLLDIDNAVYKDLFGEEKRLLFGSKTGYDFYKERDADGPDYFGLLNGIRSIINDTGANTLYLASIPEDALYTKDDVYNGSMRGLRDFPEELVVDRLKLIRPYPVFTRPNERIRYVNGYRDTPYAADTEDKAIGSRLQKYFDDTVGNKAYSDKNYYGVHNLFYALPKDKQRTAQEKAKAFLYDNFAVDPENSLISDVDKKYIYDDLSKWHNGNCHAGNVLRGVREIGQ